MSPTIFHRYWSAGQKTCYTSACIWLRRIEKTNLHQMNPKKRVGFFSHRISHGKAWEILICSMPFRMVGCYSRHRKSPEPAGSEWASPVAPRLHVTEDTMEITVDGFFPNRTPWAARTMVTEPEEIGMKKMESHESQLSKLPGPVKMNIAGWKNPSKHFCC